MFRRLLVPVDGSACAEEVLPVAARLARATGGTITLLRVVSLSPTVSVYPVVSPDVIQAWLDAALEEARSYLEGLTHHAVLAGLALQTEVVIGDRQPAATILSWEADRHMDLVIICSHGYTGFKRWALGSVAEKVVHLCSAPVLLLREGGLIPVSQPQQQHPVCALVPLDGSTEAKIVLEPAISLIAALAAPGKGTLHLMHVVTEPSSQTLRMERRAAALEKAKQYLSATVEQAREQLVVPAIASLHLAWTWSVVPDGDVAANIIQMAETGENTEGAGTPGRCDLIAMATHGYSGLQRWTMGSVTERVLRTTKLPILIVRLGLDHHS